MKPDDPKFQSLTSDPEFVASGGAASLMRYVALAEEERRKAEEEAKRDRELEREAAMEKARTENQEVAMRRGDQKVFLHSGELTSGPLLAFGEWINGEIARIPEEFRSEAQIDISSDYESSRAEIEIYYYRPETYEEQAKRAAEGVAALAAARAHELRELARLQAEYEPTAQPSADSPQPGPCTPSQTS